MMFFQESSEQERSISEDSQSEPEAPDLPAYDFTALLELNEDVQGWLYMPEAGISQYRIAAVLRVSGTVYPTVWSIFNSLYMDEQQFAEMAQEIQSRSLYSTGVSPVYGDQLLTLATCEYTQKNGRLAIVAVKET